MTQEFKLWRYFRIGWLEEEDRYKDARKLLRDTFKQNKRQCWKVLCSDVDRDPWGTPYRLVMWKLQTRQGSGAPTDIPTVLKIVEALFPKRAPRESYPRDVALEVPLFQISELELAAKRLESGKALGLYGIPNKVLRATIPEKPQLIMDLLNVWKEDISWNNPKINAWN